MTPDAPERTPGGPDPARPSVTAGRRKHSRARRGVCARASRDRGGNRARLRRSLEVGEHAKSLRFRLATLFGLDTSPHFPPPAPGTPSPGPLYRRLRLRGDHGKTMLRAHDRAAAFGAEVEFRAARR